MLQIPIDLAKIYYLISAVRKPSKPINVPSYV